MNSFRYGNLRRVQPTLCHLIDFITVQHQVGCESVMLVKKDVLVLNGQKLVQGMQVHEQLMLQIMPQRIAAHHLLRLFVQLAIDKNQWLIKIERALPQVERRLETLEQQLAQAKEEAKRPFAQEAELAEKSARLAELNSLLNMDEKGGEDALGVDEDAAETEVADKPRQPVNYAGRVAERTADNVRKPSVLAQLHAKQAERSAEPQKFPKRKSHNMEL